MKRTLFALAFAGSLAVSQALHADPVVLGDYIEARTCDVWTGPCFANGELNLRGDHAVVAWVVEKGVWNSETLDGLKVVAVLDAEGTLHTNAEGGVQSAVYIDEKATEAQGKALLALAVSLAPKHLKNIVRVEKKGIDYERKGSRASLRVGTAAEVKLETAALSGHCDTICGNEERAYPSVSQSTHVECAKTLEHTYSGAALGGARWSDVNRRSAMIGRFSL
jgi:hypothetical protein